MLPTPAHPLAPLVAERVLDAELAALVELLAGVRVPAVVAAPPGAGRDRLVDAIAAARPPDARLVEVADDDAFAWLPEAVELGWRRDARSTGATAATDRARATRDVLLVRDLAGTGDAAAGDRGRLVVRALALGYGLAAGITADGLEGVLGAVAAPPIAADDDERSRLGLVLAVEEGDGGPVVAAAHYVRPVARDVHGHVQRLPPAVLATRDRDTGRYDHFAWGVTAELAGRVGMTVVELEREQARRAGALRAAAASA